MLTDTSSPERPAPRQRAIIPDAAQVATSAPRPDTTGTALQLRMNFTDPGVAVLAAAGELDLATTPRLDELLRPRLETKLAALVLDLSELTFLGVAGLELLASTHSDAQRRDIALGIVTHSRPVNRALLRSGLDTTLPCFASVSEARSALRTPAAVAEPAEPATRHVTSTP